MTTKVATPQAESMAAPAAGVERHSRHARVGGALLGTSETMAEVRHLMSRVADTGVGSFKAIGPHAARGAERELISRPS